MVYRGRFYLGDFFESSREKGKANLPTLSVTLNTGLVDRSSIDRKTDTNLLPEQHLLVRKGDIAYNMMRMWQGASGKADKDGIVSPAYIVLSPNAAIDSGYAEYLFKTPFLIYLFWAYSYGLTKDRLRLYFNDFKRIPVDIPPIEEQRKIATILSTWDKAIATTEKLIATSKQQKKALMQQLLTGKKRLVNPETGRVFEGEWEEVTVSSTAKCFSGGTPSRKKSEYYGGSIPWITSGKLNDRFVKSVNEYITDSGVSNSSAKFVAKDCLMIAMYGATAGKVAVNHLTGATINQAILALEITDDYSSLFMFYLLEREMERAINLVQGGQPNLNASIIKGLKVSIPVLEEQQKIAQVLTTADKEIEHLESKLAYFQQEKKALMQQLLTGKRRVKVEEVASA